MYISLYAMSVLSKLVGLPTPKPALRLFLSLFPILSVSARKVPCAECQETVFLNRFATLKVRGEWFDYRDELKTYLEA